MTVNMEELKPCPFCGCESLSYSVDGGIAPSHLLELADEYKYLCTCTIMCDNCGCTIEGGAFSNGTDADLYHASMQSALDSWNNRADAILDWKGEVS